jgi:hypothetical protein
MNTAEMRLLTVTLAAACCWLCRALCQPLQVRFIAPETAHPYLRSLGRRSRLTWFAVTLSITAFLVLLMLPAGIDPNLQEVRLAATSCAYDYDNAPYDAPICYTLAPGGAWVAEELHPDGTRTLVGTVTHPAFSRGCSRVGKDVYVVNEPPSVSLSSRCP